MHDYSFERKIMQTPGRTQDVGAQHAAPLLDPCELDARLTPRIDAVATRSGDPMRLALLALFVATPVIAQEPDSAVSERAAFRWSLWSTAIPVAVGSVLWI